MERDSQTYAIIGAAMEVHRTLGPGFLEAVYQAALAIELVEKEITFQKEVLIGINYKGKELNCTLLADYICYNEVLVELKSVSKMGVNEEAQIIKLSESHRVKTRPFNQLWRSSIELQAICSLEPKCTYSVLICVICG